nr:ABC transporter substrate-binding protein [Halovivax cerinus]
MSKSQSESRREFLTYAGVGGGTLLLAGCTGNQTNGDDNGGGGDSQTFTYTTTITPSTIDPHRVSDELESIFAHNVYDPLLYYTPDTPPETKPWLAEDWEVSDDNQTYTFYLRDDATFHNGDDVTAEDVAFSVERLMTMNQGFSFMFSGVLEPDAVTAVDDKTAEITLTSQYAPFISALPFLFIANANQIRDNASADGEYGDMGDYGTEWLESNTAGSGPYEMTGRTRQSSIDHRMHDDWWGEFADGDAYEEFVIDMTPEVSTAAGKIREGEAQLSDQYLPLDTFRELDQRDDVRVSVETTFTPMYLFMHNQKAPFDDINVRKAMAHAFDYEQLIDGIMNGDSEQMQGPLPSAMWGHNDDLDVYSKDLDRAKELLDQSQYSGSDLDFTYTYVTGLSIRENMGLMLQSDLNEIGVDVEITAEPWSRITSMHQNIDESPQMTSTVLSFSYADPDNFLYPAWHSSSHGSWQSGSWYSNDRVDELLDEARQTVMQEDRVPLYEEAQQLINEDMPAVFTMNQATRYAVRESVQGFSDNGLVGYLQTPHRFTHES